MQKKKILDVTCGSRTIWFNKHHPAAVYCDIRREEYSGIWKSVKGRSERKCVIDPDIKCDFTNLPFPDESFSLVVFDPPHLKDVGDNAWLAKKYGKIETNWPQMLHEGFRECMRVLKPDGVYLNTSHVILYRTDRIRRRKGCAFKYISCYSLSW